MRVTVTGGAGYVGVETVRELQAAGHRVRAVDCLLHDQRRVAHGLWRDGVDVIAGDVRDPSVRAAAVAGADAVVHLAAIVGDPACAAQPEVAQAINVDASLALVAAARDAGVGRFVFASTCSNYGRMADPDVPIDERGAMRPVSLYARQKVAVEQSLLGSNGAGPSPTCLRFATVYGLSRRMRFDLTVNQFTRDLWARRPLEVYGGGFWRPYLHVRDAARAVRAVVEAPGERVGGQVFNVGRTDENYRKLDVVEVVRAELGGGDVTFVDRDEDPRDYRVSFDKVCGRLGFVPERRLRDGVAEVLAALRGGRFGDPFVRRYANV